MSKRILEIENKGDLNIIKKKVSLSLLDESLSDIYFVVGEDSRRIKLPANKYVLSLRSQVFKTIFYGNLSLHPYESHQSTSTSDHHNNYLGILLFSFSTSLLIYASII